MFSSPGKYFALLLLSAGLALPLRSEEPASKRQPVPSRPKSSKEKLPLAGPLPLGERESSDGKKMDFSTLPANAIYIICERAADVLRQVPDAIIMSPKKYQEMLDKIARLEALKQTDKPSRPSKCHLRGKVENNAVLLQAQFEMVTDQPNAVVALACPQAWATSAQIDGRTPFIRAEADGFFVQIEKTGFHQLTLDLIVPLTVRSGKGRGFELSLPHAAITTLELDLPSDIKDVRVGGRGIADTLLTYDNHHLRGGLGPGAMDKLDLAWKDVHSPSGVPVLIAEGGIQVRLDPAGQTTEAELLLKVEGGQTNEWHLLVPLGAEVKVLPPDDARVETTIEKADQKYASLRTIRLKESSADPLRVLVTAHSPLPRSGSLTPVGPFFVVGAARQTGTVLIRNQVRNLQLNYHERGNMRPRQPTDEQARDPTVVAMFTYGNIPFVNKPRDVTGTESLSWLDLEAEFVHAQVRTRVAHILTLRPDTTRDSLRWEITTTITPASKWTDVEQLKILVPTDWSPTDEGIQLGQEKDMRFVAYRLSFLSREDPRQPVRLQGRYEQLHKSEGRATLKLPRPLGSVEQCEVTIRVPHACEIGLSNPEQTDLELVKQNGPYEQTWRSRRALSGWQGIEVNWRSYRPELLVTSLVDLSLTGNRGDIRHEIRLQSSQSVPTPITLRVPAAIDDSLRVVEGGNLLAPRDGTANPKGILRFIVPTKSGGTDYRLVLQYTVELGEKSQLPRPGQSLIVPLVIPEQATHGETKARIWTEPGSLSVPSGGPLWDERNIEEVKGRRNLPILVLQTQRVDVPLTLRAGEQSPIFTVLLERALVRVELLEGGGQNYRASFQLRQLAGQYVDLELPGPVPTLNLKVALNRRKVTPDIVNESGQHTDGGSIARLRLGPDLVRQTALLEVSYQLPPGRTGTSPLKTILQPPLLRGTPPTVPTRWQVSLPASRVLIAPESGSGLGRTWIRRGWLLAARLNRTSADLEREFEESLPAELRHDSERMDSDLSTAPALVCWQDTVEPITLTHAPQQAWLLVCSLGLLIFGLGLFWSARPQPGDSGQMASWLWPVLALLTVGIAVAALFWPTVLWAIIYGCEPGAVVLLSVVVFQWLMHQRYRRQVIFLPSFSRNRPGSSLLRKSSSHRPPHSEPSTVDVPPPSGSISGAGG